MVGDAGAGASARAASEGFDAWLTAALTAPGTPAAERAAALARWAQAPHGAPRPRRGALLHASRADAARRCAARSSGVPSARGAPATDARRRSRSGLRARFAPLQRRAGGRRARVRLRVARRRGALAALHCSARAQTLCTPHAAHTHTSSHSPVTAAITTHPRAAAPTQRAALARRSALSGSRRRPWRWTLAGCGTRRYHRRGRAAA
jgi:hypothetical protein